MEEMILETAIEKLRNVAKELDEDLLQVVRDHWEEALPLLLDEIEHARVVPREEDLYDISLFHAAIALCAERKETRAFPALLRRVEAIGDDGYIPYGFCMLRLPAALAACAAGKVDELKQLFDNETASSRARENVFHALVHLAQRGDWDADEFAGWFSDLLENRVTSLEPGLAASILLSGTGFFPEKAWAVSKAYYDQNPDDQEMLEAAHRLLNPENIEMQQSIIDFRYLPFESAGDELSLLLDENAEDDEYDEVYKRMDDPDSLLEILDDVGESAAIEPDAVGRNDSCPCGSGKKLKKCCANKSFISVPSFMVTHLGTYVREEDRYINALMEAGYLYDDEGDRPAQLACWILCISELAARVPASLSTPDAVERKKLFVGHNPLEHWIDDFCQTVYEMFLDRSALFMCARRQIKWLVETFFGASPVLRSHLLLAQSLVCYLEEESEQAISLVRKAVKIAPKEYPARCVLAELLTKQGEAGIAEAKQVLRDGIELKPHPSLEGMLEAILNDSPDT